MRFAKRKVLLMADFWLGCERIPFGVQKHTYCILKGMVLKSERIPFAFGVVWCCVGWGWKRLFKVFNLWVIDRRKGGKKVLWHFAIAVKGMQ